VKNLTVLDHPLIRVCVTVLRDKSTPPAAFRRKLS
jgi:uracil phosphoribosyltransferase